MGTEPINYTALLKRLQARDRRAFELLYQDTRVTLYVVALDILEEEMAAQDLVQDFFIDFWQQELFHHIESSLKGYLLRAVRNRALKHLKKQQTRLRRQSAMPAPEGLVPPVLHLEQEQLGAAIATALEKVPKGAAQIFSLHYIEGISHAAIADQLGISTHTVRNQIAKALRILRKELKKTIHSA